MTRLVVAIVAGLLLIPADVLLVTSAFLYDPEPAEWLIPGMLATFAAAVALRRRWLVFVAQNVVSVLVVIRVAQGRVGPDLQALISLVVVIGVGNALAWCVASGIRRSPRGNA